MIALTAGCYRDTPTLEPQATVDLLITLLGDRDTAIRLTAAEALGKIGDQKAEPFLFRALHDSDPTVREAAARSVGWLSAAVGAEAETELVTLLRDPHASVRRAAAQALGTVGRTPTLSSSLADLLSGSSLSTSVFGEWISGW
ncbi:MAG: HEAT repeat domain-containing protein [Nitrospirae bacterium]|nr:HEAT repeat domain-containing protein [Nitrospirota bacterium]